MKKEDVVVKMSTFPGWAWRIPAEKERAVVTMLNALGREGTTDALASLNTRITAALDAARDRLKTAAPEAEVDRFVTKAKSAGLSIESDTVLEFVTIHGLSGLATMERVIEDHLREISDNRSDG